MIYWYYLHVNGTLIQKPDHEGVLADFRESDFVRAFWRIDTADRGSAWALLIEATAMGADRLSVSGLADNWGCNDADAQIYAKHIDLTIDLDGNAWCASAPSFVNLAVSPAGFGATCLEAMAHLCKQLGFSSDEARLARHL